MNWKTRNAIQPSVNTIMNLYFHRKKLEDLVSDLRAFGILRSFES